VTTVRAARVVDHDDDDDDDDDRHVISEAREAKHHAPTEMHRLSVSTNRWYYKRQYTPNLSESPFLRNVLHLGQDSLADEWEIICGL